MRSESMLPGTSPSSTPGRTPSRPARRARATSSSRPRGAHQVTTVTPARSKSSRFAARSCCSRRARPRRPPPWCDAFAPPRPRPRSSRPRARRRPAPRHGPVAGRQRNAGTASSHSCVAAVERSTAGAPAISSSSRRPRQRVPRDDLEVEGERVPDHLAAAGRSSASPRSPGPPRGAGPCRRPRSRRELVHDGASSAYEASSEQQLRDRLDDQVDRPLDGPSTSGESRAPSRRRRRARRRRSRPCRASRRPSSRSAARSEGPSRAGYPRRPRSARSPRVGLHHVQRPRLAALAGDVDEHQRVVAAHDLVGEVEPAGAEVEHPHPGGSSRPSSRLATRSRSRRRASTRCRRRRPRSASRTRGSNRLHLAGLEVQVPADVAHHVLAGDVVDRDREVHGAVVVVVITRRAAPATRWSCGVALAAGRSTTVSPRR